VSSTLAARLVERSSSGDRGALARLLTLIDDGGPGAAQAAAAVAEQAGRAWVVGITGVPGSGKSTLVDALLGHWLAQGLRVAVIAIDPSSPISGGAVLGDRIRMGRNGAHANAFIRSFSARGELGGLSRATRAAVDCFDAAGYERVIVETVGTGQSETRIVALADTRVVVCPPGLGDDVQALKAGTLEIADVLAVSKGDLPLAEQTAREMREMLTLRRAARPDAWKPRVLIVSAIARTGLDELMLALDAHREAVGSRSRRRGDDGGSGGSDGGGDAALVDLLAAAEQYRAGAVPDPSDADAWRARLAALAARDGLCASLGISVVAGGPGRSTVAMTVAAQHLNFNGGCHGGAIFALADSAFGLASNSHGPLASGIDAHITYQAAVGAGDTLVARATEVHRSRRIAVYRVDVVRSRHGADDVAVSSFTGTVYIKG
jgi:LAO/AO transport system ATPase/phenylacetic acid degradation protein PaaD